jgi:PEP-CTERM motif
MDPACWGLLIMPLSKFLSAGAAALALVVSAGAANASVSAKSPNGETYNFDLNYAVSDIIVFNNATPFDTFNQGFSTAPAGSSSITTGYLTPAQLHQIFHQPAGTHFDVSSVFLLGVASNLPGDAPNQDHLVVFTNNTFASNAQTIAFGTLFPNTNEDALISDLQNEDNPGDIFNFASGDALSGPNGAITFTPGSSFTAVAFSNGQIIGTGTSSAFFVPEPETWAMMLIGLGAIGAMARQRRGSSAAA